MSNSNIKTANAPLSAAALDRLEWIVGSSGTMWSWWVDVDRHGDDFDRPDSVTFTIEDPNDEDAVIVKTVSALSILRAHGTAKRLGCAPADAEDLDAGSADCVLQIAVLGEVVYG